jgi:hypothetical protein
LQFFHAVGGSDINIALGKATNAFHQKSYKTVVHLSAILLLHFIIPRISNSGNQSILYISYGLMGKEVLL